MANSMRDYYTNNIKNSSKYALEVNISEERMEYELKYTVTFGSNWSVEIEAIKRRNYVNWRSFTIQPGEISSFPRPNKTEHLTITHLNGKVTCKNWEVHNCEPLNIQPNGLITIERGYSSKSFNSIHEALAHSRQTKEDN